jgi:hypothetical protein
MSNTVAMHHQSMLIIRKPARQATSPCPPHIALDALEGNGTLRAIVTKIAAAAVAVAILNTECSETEVARADRLTALEDTGQAKLAFVGCAGRALGEVSVLAALEGVALLGGESCRRGGEGEDEGAECELHFRWCDLKMDVEERVVC